MNNDNITEEDNYLVDDYEEEKQLESTKKFHKKRKGIIIPIIITILIVPFCIYFIKDIYFTDISDLAGEFSGFNRVGSYMFLLLNIFVLKITWIIYLVLLSISKERNKEKGWWIPILLIIVFEILQVIVININNVRKDLKDNPQIYNKNYPIIESYNSATEVPVYAEYKLLGKDVDIDDVYNNIEKYRNLKVLVDGKPYSTITGSDTYDNSIIAIRDYYGKNEFLYRFTFKDKSSEFYKKGEKIFDNILEYEYYDAFIYGKIIGAQSYYDGGREYKLIDIEPEKIYYTYSKSSSNEEDISK